MSYVIVGAVCLAIGYGAAYLQHNPEKRAELIALFKKKPPAP